ncbi:class I SAM-dependent methyltransferase [Streptomyces sp. NPDC053367]|uniref:class I SAM-dependent methyltransferase n=1 Tax=Streptomyces sp. NPDC053367 TaxID=3365700 RepID=UPI0037D8AC24
MSPETVTAQDGYGPDFAGIYDLIYTLRGKDYAAEAAFVADSILERRPGAASLLDVACGTGAHLAHLADRFAHAEGLELSPAMLARARERLPGLTLHQGDMRTFALGRRYSALTCLFTAVAHQNSTAELRATAGRFAAHLEPGGVAVIDPWWFPETFLDGYVTADVLTPDHRTITRLSYSVREGDSSRMDVHYVVADPVSGARHFTESYRHRLFPRAAYERALTDSGFAVEYLDGALSGRGLFIATLEGRQPS